MRWGAAILAALIALITRRRDRLGLRQVGRWLAKRAAK